MDRELILLSPYRYPGQNSLQLANEDMASWLNGYSALWHPAFLWQAKAPPRFEAPYDYEDPKPGHVYAVPDSPPTLLPEDWDNRVKANGAVAFRATPDRETTLKNLTEALGPVDEPTQKLLALSAKPLAAFFGLGLGHLLQETLSEAMEHENLLDRDGFWQDIQRAIASLAGVPMPNPEPAYEDTTDRPADFEEFAPMPGEQPPLADASGAPESFEEFAPPYDDRRENTETTPDQDRAGSVSDGPELPEAWQSYLRSAAEKLLSAREVLYPVTIHLLDLVILDEKNLNSWPDFSDLPVNVIASSSLLEKLASEHPDRFERIRTGVQNETIEVCGGSYLEREDPYLPLDSQLWNLRKGQTVAKELLGKEPAVFARRRFGFHPQMPLLLSTTGMLKAVLLTFDESGVPQYQTCVVGWPSPDGKQIDAFVRPPHPVDNPLTFFNLGHYLFKTTREDHSATVVFVHTGAAAAPWYHDFLALAQFAPVMGQWFTLSRYFNDVMAGEHASTLSADEFHSDYLSERTGAHVAGPVSDFARHLRLRRRIDTCWTLAALHRALAGRNDTLSVDNELSELETNIETAFAAGEQPEPISLTSLEQRIASSLAARLQSRAADNQPGSMVLNPCSFTRRLALEFEGAAWPLPIGGPVKACQLDGSLLRVVVEVPPLGFTWIPRQGPPGTPAPALRMKLADKNFLRNEFFEVEIDPLTGGLRAIRDHKTRINRLGQRLVFNPGSSMRLGEMKITSAGPALGEITTEGTLVGEHEQVLARYKQRLRAWLGRPLLEMRIEILPEQPPAGYPWHAYFGSRFAWRDERGVLLRGVNGTGYITTHTRPQSADYLEVRLARQSTTIFPGGMPFHQRHEGRMLDVILIPEGERARAFDIGIALDREHPMQPALGFATPAVVVPTAKGAPHIGATGWLFHLDAPNLLLTRLMPGGQETDSSRDLTDAITARILETHGHSGQAEFRCVRNPARATLLDGRGGRLIEVATSGDAVLFEVTPNDLVHLQVEFS